MMITAEVSDLVRGCAAARIPSELDVFITGHGWREVGHGVTNDEGFILDFGEPAAAGVYRVMFDVASYMPHIAFPSVTITVEVRDPAERCHLRLLLSTFGYTAQRA